MDSSGTQNKILQLEKENRLLRRAVEEHAVLDDDVAAISSTLSLERIVELIIQKCVKHLKAEQGAVMLLNEEGQQKSFHTMLRRAATSKEVLPYRLDAQLTGWMLKNQKPLFVNDLSTDTRFQVTDKENFSIYSLLSVPLRLKGQMIGLLNVFNKHSDAEFTDNDGKLLTIIAAQSAQAIENARLYRVAEERLNKLNQAHSELSELNENLEKKVKDRTNDLNEKNEELAKSLTHLRQMQTQLIMKEKMALVGNLVAGVAHEINNPVGAINSASDTSSRCIGKIENILSDSELTEKSEKDRQYQKLMMLLKDNTQMIKTSGKRIAEIIRNLKNFTRLDESEFQRTDIHEGIDSTLALIQHNKKEGIQIIKEYGELPLVPCYPGQLNQVFMNLLLNAIQSIESEGKIFIKTDSDSQNISIRFSDTGKGIRPDKLDKLFDFGFSAHSSRVKIGSGLLISYYFIQKHNGAITVKSEPGKGSTFTIILPI